MIITESRSITPTLVGLLFAFSANSAFADVLTIDTSAGGQVGGFYGPYMPGDMAPPSYPTSIMPDNSPGFQNYFMGRTTTSPLGSGFTTPERRVFFIFDMSGLAIPAGHSVSDVTIDLELLPGGTSALANFTGDMEVVEFTSTVPDPILLDPGLVESEWIPVWDTLGSGDPYGALELLGPGSGSPSLPGTYTIPLPGSLSDVTDAILGGDIFVVSSKLATYDPGPIGAGAPPAADPYEYVFGGTDVVFGAPTGLAAPLLTITTVPEPNATLLLMSLFATAIVRRPARSRRGGG